MVTVRYKKLASGKYSIYLDCYDVTKKERHYEFLKQYVAFDYNKKSKVLPEDLAIMQSVQSIVAERTKNDAPIDTINPLNETNTLLSFIEEQHNNGLVLYTKAFTKHLKKYLALTKDPILTDIDSEWVEQFANYCKATYSVNHTRTLIQHLQSILSLARKNGFETVNPSKQLTDYPLTVKDLEYLTDEETDLLIQSQTTFNPHIRDAFLFSLYSGLRWQDMKTLKRDNVMESVNELEIVNGLKTVNASASVNRLSKLYSLTLSHVYSKTVYMLELNAQASEIITNYLKDKTPDQLVFDKLPNMTNCFTKLRLWGYQAGLQKDLSFSKARNTFMFKSIQKNDSITQMCKELGLQRRQKVKIIAKRLKNHDSITV